MWRIHQRFSVIAISRMGECRSCTLSEQASRVSSPARLDAQALRSDGMAMATLRQIVQRHDAGGPMVSRLTDDHVLRQVERLVERGALHLCAGADPAGSPRPGEPSRRTAQDDVVQAILALQVQRDLSCRGRSYRLIRAGEWRQYRAGSDYEIVPHAQARDVIGAMSTDPRAPAADRRTLVAALELLSGGDRRPSDATLVLLRAATAPPRKSSDNDVVTPSAFAAAKAPKENIHWIEIELVGEDGVAVPGQDYLIVTPDKRRFTGTTDSSGRARLEDIVAGQCSISFVNIDRSAWSVA